MLKTLSTIIRASNISQIRNYARSHRKKFANPGIQKRLNILDEQDESNLQNVDVEELESDFMSVGEMHREHEKELNFYRDKEKYWIVKQKYFKDRENQVNFLTWNDKEQIRYLHQTNPAEWTLEKLAEGFPALPETISKIIKSKWNKNDAKRENHDRAVETNWKLLKEGKLDLPENLVKHLGKFTSRQKQEHPPKKHINPTKTVKIGEFSSIVEGYNKTKPKQELIDQHEMIDQQHELIDQKYKMKNYGNKMVPLRLIKSPSIEQSKPQTQNVELDKLFHGDKYLKTQSTPTSISNKSKSEVVQYPEKIQIPKNKYKKGYTYKVNDCYYDDDGLFLYRVPGMY